MRMIAVIVTCLALTGCASSGVVQAGAGFKPLNPSPATRNFIVQNDPPFAREVVDHNAFGRKRGYWK